MIRVGLRRGFFIERYNAINVGDVKLRILERYLCGFSKDHKAQKHGFIKQRIREGLRRGFCKGFG